ncbi:coadhesin isoform X1 [Patella vulgata]|uniref:coadhesin isoform X1 n=1 Tax=Patella vulgata TaxID=6465 RepID=UPI00217F9958|nr:coadhesin isoform X1 [Patella vulgata]
MRFILAATLVLVIIITVVDAGRRHRVRNGIRRRYSYGRQLSMWRRYHQRRTLKQISCDQIRRSQICSRCCAVDGNWGPWSGCNACSVTCGNGTQSRSRSCDNPSPAYGGVDCHGDGIETQSCNTMIDCPVDGNWGTWSEFSTCCSVCGVVEQKRSRVCDNPPPEFGGADCPGEPVETRNCDSNDCLNNVTTPLCANQSFDVMVLLDASAKITDDELGQERDLIQQLYTELRIDGDARRFGFLAHGGFSIFVSIKVLRLEKTSDITTQQSSINDIKKIGGTPILGDAINVLVGNFERSERFTWPDIRQIGIVITAAEALTPINETSIVANDAKAKNISMYAIGIGDRVSEEFVHAIASNPTGAITTTSSKLNETATRLERLICFCDQ